VERTIFLTAATLTVCFAVAAAQAENFIAAQAFHECAGENCAVCPLLQLAEAFTWNIRNAPAAAFFLFIAAVDFFVLGRAVFSRAAVTQVALKNRLNR
jgi:hypothetical protein